MKFAYTLDVQQSIIRFLEHKEIMSQVGFFSQEHNRLIRHAEF